MRDLDRRQELGRIVAREAGLMAADYQRDPDALVIDQKGPQDWVTAADREVETLIRSRLVASFPNDTVLGEEGGGEITDAMWVVDPIDGTTNFLRGLPEYAVSIAFVADGVTELGFIAVPALDHLYEARRGAGATRNGQPISTSDVARMDRALVTVGFDPKDGVPHFVERLRRILDAGAAFRRFGAATIGLAAVASGSVDAFWQTRLNPWDVLAGLLLVREAGGRTNDFLANDGLRNGNPTLASAPKIASEIARLVDVDLG